MAKTVYKKISGIFFKYKWSYYMLIVKKYFLSFFVIKYYLISLRRILKIAMGNMTIQKTVR